MFLSIIGVSVAQISIEPKISMQKRLSIKAIAKDLNLSPTTVSLVLNNKALANRISPGVIEKVRNHVEEIGYQPNRVAQCLRTGKSKMVVFMVEDISNPFFSAVAKIIEKHLFQEGYTTVYCSTDNEEDKVHRLIRQFNHHSMDAYIIAPPADFNISKLNQLVSKGKKILLYGDQVYDVSDGQGDAQVQQSVYIESPPAQVLADELSRQIIKLLFHSPSEKANVLNRQAM